MELDLPGRGPERAEAGDRAREEEWAEENGQEWARGAIVYAQAVGKRLPINPELPAPTQNAQIVAQQC